MPTESKQSIDDVTRVHKYSY